MRTSQLLAPLVASSLTLACGSKDPAPAPAPAPTAAPAPAPSPSQDPAPTPTPTADAAPAPADAAAPEPVPAPVPTTCNSDYATFRDLAGTPVGNFAGAVKHATKAEVADDAAAEAALADTYSVFLKSPDALVTHIEKGLDEATRATTNLYARLVGDKGFVAFVDFHEKLGEHLDVKVSTLADRYLVVAVEEEFHERVPACLNDEVDEEDCEGTATGDGGGVLAYHVVDRELGRLLFSFGYSREANETCEGAKPPTLDGQTWTAYGCNGAPEAFTVAEITPCTPAFHEKRMADERAAEEKKRAEEEAAAAAKRLPDAEVTKLIDEGRKLTSDKDYSGAIAAFDKVIAANPDAIRAHTGRAFALLSRAEGDDLDQAEKGFEEAYQLTKVMADRDDKLRSQIMFNRGLIAEKQGKAELAKRFFQKAHDLSPSPATEKKLAE
jgi:tetratricopeptide (TPR) repeat protein